jgi:hypothetical protein
MIRYNEVYPFFVIESLGGEQAKDQALNAYNHVLLEKPYLRALKGTIT